MAHIEAVKGRKIDEEHTLMRVDPKYERVATAGIQGGVHAIDNELRRMIAENHTGNHYRNKTIAVPTAIGQPVRA